MQTASVSGGVMVPEVCADQQKNSLVYWENRKVRAMQVSHAASAAIIGGGTAYIGTAISYGILAVPPMALVALACAIIGCVYKVFSALDKWFAEQQIRQFSQSPSHSSTPPSTGDREISIDVGTLSDPLDVWVKEMNRLRIAKMDIVAQIEQGAIRGLVDEVLIQEYHAIGEQINALECDMG